MIAFSKADPETLTWMLQTYLLLAYFEIHCGSEGKRAHAFPHCVKVNSNVHSLSLVMANSYVFSLHKKHSASYRRVRPPRIRIGCAGRV